MIEWSEPNKPDGKENFYDYVSFICPVFGEFKIEWKSWKEDDTYDCWGDFIKVSENSLDDAKSEFCRQYKEAALKMLKISEES